MRFEIKISFFVFMFLCQFSVVFQGAKRAMEQHSESKRRILKVPVENVDNVGQRLLQRYLKNKLLDFPYFLKNKQNLCASLYGGGFVLN